MDEAVAVLFVDLAEKGFDGRVTLDEDACERVMSRGGMVNWCKYLPGIARGIVICWLYSGVVVSRREMMDVIKMGRYRVQQYTVWDRATLLEEDNHMSQVTLGDSEGLSAPGGCNSWLKTPIASSMPTSVLLCPQACFTAYYPSLL